MKHNEQLFDAIGGLDADIVAAAAPAKRAARTMPLRRAIPLAACFALALIIGVAAWRMNTPEIKHQHEPHYSAEDTNVPASVDTVEATAATYNELAIARRWEEMTDPERFLEFQVGENSYHTRATKIDGAHVGERLGEAPAIGYDIYTDSTHSTTVEYFAIEGISTECALAVRFPDAEEYCVYANYWYRPETLEELISVLSLRENMTFGDFHTDYIYEDGCHEQVTFHDPDDGIVWEMLLSDTSLPNVWEDTAWYVSVMSIGVRIPLLGYHVSLWLTEDGYLCTNILDTGKAFYIGEEKVADFLLYVVTHCTDRTVTGYNFRQQEGAQTSVDGEPEIAEMTTQGYFPGVETAVEGQTTAAPPYGGAVTSPAYNPFTTSEE